jgi:hypothetical protein
VKWGKENTQNIPEKIEHRTKTRARERRISRKKKKKTQQLERKKKSPRKQNNETPGKKQRGAPRTDKKIEPPEPSGVFWNAPVPDIYQRHRCGSHLSIKAQRLNPCGHQSHAVDEKRDWHKQS